MRNLSILTALSTAAVGDIFGFPVLAPRPHRLRIRNQSMSVERGRLTRASRRGYVTPVKIKGDPDRYLNSHARGMRALKKALA